MCNNHSTITISTIQRGGTDGEPSIIEIIRILLPTNYFHDLYNLNSFADLCIMKVILKFYVVLLYGISVRILEGEKA